MTLADDRRPIPASKLTADWPAVGSPQFLADNCGQQTLAVLEQVFFEEILRVRIENSFRQELKATKANSYQKQEAN